MPTAKIILAFSYYTPPYFYIKYNYLVLYTQLYKKVVLLSMDMKTKIAENIKFYRKQMGLTQGQLADMLNGKKSLVSNYENGYSTPDIYTLCRLAVIFDVSLDDLVEYEKD